MDRTPIRATPDQKIGPRPKKPRHRLDKPSSTQEARIASETPDRSKLKEKVPVSGLHAKKRQTMSPHFKRAHWFAAIGTVAWIGLIFTFWVNDGKTDTVAYTNTLHLAILQWVIICYGAAFINASASSNYRAYASGIKGEALISKTLKKLGDGFSIHHEVLVPNDRSRTGHTEIDFAVIGKKAIYLIEVKNNKGRIQVSANPKDRRWKVYRNPQDEISMRNPVQQVEIQKRVLKKALNQRGGSPEIKTLVVFSNPHAVLENASTSLVPVFQHPFDGLLAEIRKTEERYKARPDIHQAQMNERLTLLNQEGADNAKTSSL